MRTIIYDIEEYSFKDIVSGWLSVKDLSKLHEIKEYKHFDRKHDQSTIWHKKFYEMIRIDTTFNEVYVNFLEDKIKPLF